MDPTTTVRTGRTGNRFQCKICREHIRRANAHGNIRLPPAVFTIDTPVELVRVVCRGIDHSFNWTESSDGESHLANLLEDNRRTVSPIPSPALSDGQSRPLLFRPRQRPNAPASRVQFGGTWEESEDPHLEWGSAFRGEGFLGLDPGIYRIAGAQGGEASKDLLDHIRAYESKKNMKTTTSITKKGSAELVILRATEGAMRRAAGAGRGRGSSLLLSDDGPRPAAADGWADVGASGRPDWGAPRPSGGSGSCRRCRRSTTAVDAAARNYFRGDGPGLAVGLVLDDGLDTARGSASRTLRRRNGPTRTRFSGPAR